MAARSGRAVSGSGLSLGAAAIAVTLTGCGPVEISSPDLAGAELRACQRFVAALPEGLAEQPTVDITPEDALGAAWGDPAIVVTCGVEQPAEYTDISSCEQADGVGWFVPDAQISDQDADVTATAVGSRPRIEIRIPGALRPDAVAAAFVELAPLVLEHTEVVQPCH